MKIRIRSSVLCVLTGAIVLTGPGAYRVTADVRSTVHNLSASGPGSVKTQDEEAVCVFCHAPHGATEKRALWNRPVPRGRYVVRNSLNGGRSFRSPDGASKLCLSCHDGSISLGRLGNRKKELRIRGTSAGRLPAASRGYIGRNLAGLHPVSVEYTEAARRWENLRAKGMIGIETRFVAASSVERALLDDQGKVQCTSCHDPHEDQYFKKGEVPHFSRKPSVEEICVSCHRW